MQYVHALAMQYVHALACDVTGGCMQLLHGALSFQVCVRYTFTPATLLSIFQLSLRQVC
jgi:hypothetical protein